MNWINTILPYLTLSSASTVILTCTAVFGVYIAWRGLNTWQDQENWQVDTKLARQILVALYKFRNALYAVRNPHMSSTEMVSGLDTENPDEGIDRGQGIINAYSNRWSHFLEVKNVLDALLLEANAVWGEELSGKLIEIQKLESELFVYINLYLNSYHRGEQSLRKGYHEIIKEKRNILYDILNEGDVFRKDFVAALEPVESYLKTKLRYRN